MVWLWVDMLSHLRHQLGQAAAWTSQSGHCCKRLDTAEKWDNLTDFSDYRLSRHNQLTRVFDQTDQNFVLGELSSKVSSGVQIEESSFWLAFGTVN